MKQFIAFIFMVLTACFLVLTASAQQAGSGTDPKYLLLATSKTSTMQKELDEASDKGYRVLVGSPTNSEEMVLFLEKAAQPPEKYEYKLLATTRTSTMQKELNEMAAGGFRLMPRTMIAKKQIMGSVEIVAMLERTPGVQKEYKYKLLATTLTSTLQKEVGEAIDDGYVLIGLVSRGEHMVIMEREIGVR